MSKPSDGAGPRFGDIDILIEGGDWDADRHAAIVCEMANLCAGWPDTLPDRAVDLSVLLTSDEAMAVLNTDWRGKEGATNVLSFPALSAPLQDGPPLLGDLVFAYETIAREAAEQSKSFEDHLRHLVVHGVLHLCGYDHLTDEEAAEMEALERDILARCGVADPYAEDGQQAPSAPSSAQG